MNIILLNAGPGYRVKSYGPKCLLKLANKEAVIERQLRIITDKYEKANIYSSIGFDAHKIKKYKPIKKYNIVYNENEDFINTNNLYSLKKILIENDIKGPCFVMYGDIVFGEKTFPSIPKCNTVFTSQNTDIEKIGVSSNNSIVSHMMWDIENTWSELVYFDKDFIDIIKNYDCQKFEFLFELINNKINEGVEFKVAPFGSEVIDIDLLTDLDIADGKFSIDKA